MPGDDLEQIAMVGIILASWRELHARGQKLLRLRTAAAEVPERLGVRAEWWREIGVACGQRAHHRG